MHYDKVSLCINTSFTGSFLVFIALIITMFWKPFSYSILQHKAVEPQYGPFYHLWLLTELARVKEGKYSNFHSAFPDCFLTFLRCHICEFMKCFR